MKNFKKLLALALTMMMLVSALCVMSVHADDGRKFWVSHINKDDTFANASVIFTEAYMKENNFETIGDITAAYKARMGAEVEKVDPDWNNAHTDHKYQSYYTLACQWNAENGRYEVVTAVALAKSGAVTCPENGFVITMHADRDIAGKEPHNYPSTKFGEKNLGQPGSAEYITATYWKSFANQPVYLYNIDLEKASIVTSGTFESKLSAAGIAKGLTEDYSNFTSESYITVGGEDSAATVDAYFPKNVKISYSSVSKQMKEYEKLDKLDWSTASWTALEGIVNKYKTQFESEDQSLDQKTVNAWANEIKDAINALEPYDPNEETAESTTPGTTTGGEFLNTGAGTENTEGKSAGFPIWIIIVVGVFVLAAVAFVILVALKNKGGKKEAVVAAEAAAEEAAPEAAEAEAKEETKE